MMYLVVLAFLMPLDDGPPLVPVPEPNFETNVELLVDFIDCEEAQAEYEMLLGYYDLALENWLDVIGDWADWLETNPEPDGSDPLEYELWESGNDLYELLLDLAQDELDARKADLDNFVWPVGCWPEVVIEGP